MTDKTMKKRRLAPVASLALLLLGGCSFIPEYIRPSSPVPEAWPTGAAYQNSSAAQQASGSPVLADLGWEEFFRSPQLRSLIDQALANDRDLRVAALNVQQSQAQYRIQRSELLPEADVGGGIQRQRTPGDLSRTGRATITSLNDVSVGVTSYELDLFGRVRSLEQSALESFFATDQARVATQIALAAEVANAYLTLLADKELLKLTEDTLRDAAAVLRFDRAQLRPGRRHSARRGAGAYRRGYGRANRAAYVRQIAQDKNALNLLVGSPVGDQVLDKAPSLGTGDFVASLPVGLPSDLLQRRPDIIEAEYNLRAANANTGAARAAFFPTISLTASAGTASASLSGLFEGGSGVWVFAPQINLPIFDFGRREANLESAKVQREIGVAQYERSIQALSARYPTPWRRRARWTSSLRRKAPWWTRRGPATTCRSCAITEGWTASSTRWTASGRSMRRSGT